MSEKPYRYFISFFHPNGFGNIDIALKKPIENSIEIELIEEEISRIKGYSDITVINFKLFDKSEVQA